MTLDFPPPHQQAVPCSLDIPMSAVARETAAGAGDRQQVACVCVAGGQEEQPGGQGGSPTLRRLCLAPSAINHSSIAPSSPDGQSVSQCGCLSIIRPSVATPPLRHPATPLRTPPLRHPTPRPRTRSVGLIGKQVPVDRYVDRQVVASQRWQAVAPSVCRSISLSVGQRGSQTVCPPVFPSLHQAGRQLVNSAVSRRTGHWPVRPSLLG